MILSVVRVSERRGANTWFFLHCGKTSSRRAFVFSQTTHEPQKTQRETETETSTPTLWMSKHPSMKDLLINTDGPTTSRAAATVEVAASRPHSVRPLESQVQGWTDRPAQTAVGLALVSALKSDHQEQTTTPQAARATPETKEKDAEVALTASRERQLELLRQQTSNGPKRCLHCQTTNTPLWRGGPLGPKTLCNACGIRYLLGEERQCVWGRFVFQTCRVRASPAVGASAVLSSHCRL